MKTAPSTGFSAGATLLAAAFAVIAATVLLSAITGDPAPESPQPVPIPSSTDGGYIQFRVFVVPAETPADHITFSNLVVNGISYQVDPHPPTAGKTWESPRIPNDRSDKTTASLTITVKRSADYLDGITIGCTITSDKGRLPGYSFPHGPQRRQTDVVTYTCKYPRVGS